MIIKLRRMIYIFLGYLGLIVPNKNKKITILCYHSIDSTNWSHGISKNKFSKQIKYLSEKYDFWNMYDLLEFMKGNKILDRDKVIITFDDGYKNIKQVLDITDKYAVKPTVFIISEASNRNYGELENHKRLLNDNDLKELVSHGWTIGSHTSTHPNLKNLNNSKLSFEINDSKKTIEKRLNIKCDFIAYPKGKYNEDALVAVQNSGYLMGLTMDDGFVSMKSNYLKIPRIGINRTHSDTEFKYLDGFLNIIFRRIIKYYLYD